MDLWTNFLFFFLFVHVSSLSGSISKSSGRLSDSGNFFSSFHSTPERRKFSKDEWEKFTRATTRKALEGLVSSPDFNKWAVANADRITLTPKKEAQDHQRRWFRWLWRFIWFTWVNISFHQPDCCTTTQVYIIGLVHIVPVNQHFLYVDTYATFD